VETKWNKKPIVGNATENGGVHMGKGKTLP
jgi:hypothetical protein